MTKYVKSANTMILGLIKKKENNLLTNRWASKESIKSAKISILIESKWNQIKF